MIFLIIILLAYVFGSIPWGYVVARLQGVDIRQKGSGSIGATNIYRTLGLSYAVFVGLLDVFKGVLVMGIAKFSLNNHYEIALIALAVIVGHMFSIFLKGKGGKGIATTFGVLLVLIGWETMLLALLIWLGLLIFTRYMSLTNLVMIWFFPIFYVFVQPDFAFFILGIIVTMLVYWAHRGNIERLKEGREPVLHVTVGFRNQNPTKELPLQNTPVKKVKTNSKKK